MTKHTISLPDGTFARLQTMADRSGRSADELILDAIDAYVLDREDIELAEDAYREHLTNPDAAEALDVLSVRLGLDG